METNNAPGNNYETAAAAALAECRRLQAYMVRVADELRTGKLDQYEAALRLKNYWRHY